MLYFVIVLFAIAAVLGIVIFRNWLTAAKTSRTVVYLHGIVAATALVLLIVFTLQSHTGLLQASIILFVLTALGGLYMFVRDLRGKFSPTALAATHGLLAVAGFLLLIFYML
jgi:hypothetical protein